MKNIIKEYDLRKDITIPKLIEAGFKQINPTQEEPFLRCYYSRELADEIELQIDIKPLDKFDFSRDVIVFDKYYGHLFNAFYDEDRDYAFLNDLINVYNREMDQLVKCGVFEEKKIKKVKKLTNEI